MEGQQHPNTNSIDPEQGIEEKTVAQFEKTSSPAKPKHNFWRYLAAVAVLVVFGLILTTLFSLTKSYMAQMTQIRQTVLLDEVGVTDFAIVAMDTIEMDDSIDPVGAIDDTLKESFAQNDTTIIVKDEIVEEKAAETAPFQAKAEERISETTEPQLDSTELYTAQFKEEFWALIHRQDKRMTEYGKLYRKYYGKVDGNEYHYLWITILGSTTRFKAWSEILNQVPSNEIKSIHTINALKQILEDYE